MYVWRNISQTFEAYDKKVPSSKTGWFSILSLVMPSVALPFSPATKKGRRCKRSEKQSSIYPPRSVYPDTTQVRARFEARGETKSLEIFRGIRTRVQERSYNVSTSVFDRRANVFANALHLCLKVRPAARGGVGQVGASPGVIGLPSRCQLSEKLAPVHSPISRRAYQRRHDAPACT